MYRSITKTMSCSGLPKQPASKHRTLLRRGQCVLLTLAATALATSVHAACEYTVTNQWNNGFTASVKVTNNTGAAVNGWNVSWQYSGDNRVTNSWNAQLSGSNPYTAANVGWNGSLQPGQSAEFGFQGTKGNAAAQAPAVTGSLCGGTVSSSSSSASSTPVSSSSSSATSTDSSSSSSYAAPSDNFAQNGGVEDELTNWGTTAGTVTRSTQERHSGAASAYITGRTDSWHGLTFNVGTLTTGNDYDVAVWVKLAAGSPDSVVMLTAKRQDDSDSSTYNEYTQVAMATASASEWTLLQGIYTQSGTAFEHFIIESDSTTVSFYADDFSIVGEVDDGGDPGNPGGGEHGFFIGNITTSGAVRSDFTQYWDQITPENEGKWGSIEGTRDVYNWGPLDRIYEYARANGIPVKAHTFVWGNQSPSWINNLSPAEIAGEIEEWIRDYCARYPDTAMIDVVNESTPGHAPAQYAQRAYGNDWIIRVFQIARQHCPNSILILNDYNVLSWNTEEFIAMARPAVQAGVVDALGMQAHGLEDWSLNDISRKLNQIAALGLPIYISEYDVARTNDQQQLQIMQQQFPLFYNHPSVVGITLWGYVVGRTWVNGSGLIQENGSPRPAMTWLMNYIGR